MLRRMGWKCQAFCATENPIIGSIDYRIASLSSAIKKYSNGCQIKPLFYAFNAIALTIQAQLQ